MVQLALTGLVGLLAALQPTFAAPQRNPGNSDPTACVADGKLYRSGRTYRMNGEDYIVRCARGSTGNVVATEKVMRGGFATCFNICQRRKACAGFTYLGDRERGNCQFKNNIGGYPVAGDDSVTCEKNPNGPPGRDPEPIPSSGVGSSESASKTSSTSLEAPTSRSDLNTFSRTGVSTSSSMPTPPATSQCQEADKTYGEVYRAGSGSAYQLSCGTDHYGGDLNDAGSDSFLGCISICDSRPDCIGYAYTPGNCWLKSYYTQMQVNPGVDFALNLERNSTAKPRTSATTSPTSTTPMIKPTPVAGSCGYLTGDSFQSDEKIRYTFACGADHNGGDLGAVSAARFVVCADICDKTDKCIAYAWVGGNGPGTCYLKGSITNRESLPDVDYAYKDAATYLPGSSSSSSGYGSISSTSVSTSSASLLPPEEKTSSTTVSSAYKHPPPPPPKETTSSTKSKSGTQTVIVTSTASQTSSTLISTSTATDKPTESVLTWARHTKSKPHHTKSHHTKSHHTREHHTKEHHTKPHHTKLHHTIVPSDSAASTSCRTITFSTSGTTSLSTVTDYVSRSYTHVEWVTKTSSNSSAGASTTTTPSSTTVPTTTPAPTTPQPTTPTPSPTSERPTKTHTEPGISPTHVAHDDYCKELRDIKKIRKLRVRVLKGNRKFHDMWVANPPRKRSSQAELTEKFEDAAWIFLNPSTNAIASWLDKETCEFWGLNMIPARGGSRPKHHKEGHKAHDNLMGDCVFAANQGSSLMFSGLEGVTWNEERFKGWVVCEAEHGMPQLSFLDKYATHRNRHDDLRDECAAVRLFMDPPAPN